MVFLKEGNFGLKQVVLGLIRVLAAGGVKHSLNGIFGNSPDQARTGLVLPGAGALVLWSRYWSFWRFRYLTGKGPKIFRTGTFCPKFWDPKIPKIQKI
jgi:hypothetical protein